MAQFQVVQTINIENAFFIRGVVLEGQVNEGMQIYVSLNNSMQVTGEISAIKKVNNQYEIKIQCLDYEDIEIWEMLNLQDDIIEIK